MSPAAVAAAVEVGAQHPGSEVLELSMALTIVVAAVVLLGILAALVFYRRRQMEGPALWLHLLVLAVLPLFLMAIGGFATFEYVKEVQFCGTCHLTMKAYVDDLHNPRSASLAAAHFQNRVAVGTECYACHANYGLHGTMEAKLTGLRHVWKYNMNTYHVPLTMPAPFENGLCLKCHEGAKRFMAQSAHLEGDRVAPEFRSGQTECISCHGPVHEVPRPKPPAKQARAAKPPAVPAPPAIPANSESPAARARAADPR